MWDALLYNAGMVTTSIDIKERLNRIVDDCRQVFVNLSDDRIVAVFLYGSVLTANWRSDSDLDVAVLDLTNTPLSWDDEAYLMDSLEKVTGLQVDLRFFRDCTLSHQYHIFHNGISIWNQDPGMVESYTKSIESNLLQNKETIDTEWVSTVNRFIRSSESTE